MTAASVARRFSMSALPLLVGVLLLAGCGPKPNAFAPYCPAPKRLTDAAQVTIYRAGSTGTDITDQVLQGAILDVSGTCQTGDKNTVAVDTSVTFRFNRGPAMRGTAVDVPYLMTVTLGDDDIRDQKTFAIHVVFPSNIDTVTLISEPVHMIFPTNKTTSAASYAIWAAFRLTQQQLDYNRLRGL